MTSEWRTLENLHLLLKPFAQYTSLVSGKEYTTISSIIPIVMKINLHLEEMKKVPELTAVSTRLQSELKLRFRRYTHPVPSNHEPVFLCPLSWILNLNYCSILLKQILLKPNSFVYWKMQMENLAVLQALPHLCMKQMSPLTNAFAISLKF